jgi:uncharacterized protein (TIGR02453 family)
MSARMPIDEDLLPPFDGFPEGAFTFLRTLKRNNTRTWFQTHKTEYEEYVRFPMKCLVAALGQRMAENAPEFEFNPRTSIFRVYRDVRFSRNKEPYKTNVAASFAMRGASRSTTEMPGLYVGIEPGEIFIGGGLYMPTGDQLKAIRKSIAGRPEEYLALIRDRRFTRRFGGVMGERLQRAPLGYGADHAMIDHLRLKQFYVGAEPDERQCRSARFAGVVAAILMDALPFVRWLAKAVG